MATTASRTRGSATVLSGDSRSVRLRLAHLDQDQADLERARDLLHQGEAAIADDPREAFELIHRAALRGAGIIVARANRDRRRRLPLNVWTALERIGGEDAGACERSGSSGGGSGPAWTGMRPAVPILSFCRPISSRQRCI